MKLNKVLSTIGIASIIGISAVGAIVSRAKEQDFQVSALDNSEQQQEDVLSELDFRVVELRNNGILIGDENGNLNLGSELKRQEMIVLLSRLMGKEAEAKSWNTSNLTFADVQKDNWATPYIAWAKENNITKGYSDELFGYDDSLTTTQTQIFLLRILGNDVEMENANDVANKEGIMKDIVSEQENIIRSDVAKMLYNTLNSICDDETGETLGEKLNIKSEYTKEEIELKMNLKYYNVEFLKKVDVTNDWVYIYIDSSESTLREKNEEEYKAFIHSIIGVIDYINIKIIDIDNDLEIIAYCDMENYKVQALEINGVYNYFNMKETF